MLFELADGGWIQYVIGHSAKRHKIIRSFCVCTFPTTKKEKKVVHIDGKEWSSQVKLPQQQIITECNYCTGLSNRL